MAIKKVTEGPKAKLMKLSVATLRKKAKALNISNYTTRTKENLVQSIMITESRKKGGKTSAVRKTTGQTALRLTRSGEQTGRSDTARDEVKRALAPGKRLSRNNKVYYERRRNRSDVPPTMLGASRGIVQDLAFRIYDDYYQYDNDFDFSEAFSEVIDGYAVYYSEAMDVIRELGYYNWEDNDLGIQPTNINQVAYLALYELEGDVYSEVQKKIKSGK